MDKSLASLKETVEKKNINCTILINSKKDAEYATVVLSKPNNKNSDFKVKLFATENQRIKSHHAGHNVFPSLILNPNNTIAHSKKEIETVVNILVDAYTNNNKQLLRDQETFARSPLGMNYYGRISRVDALAHHVFAQTIPEPFDNFLVEKLFVGCKTIVDIGTNTGLYCFIAAKEPTCKRVHVFEPQPDCTRQVNKTISINNWQDKINVHTCALGEKSAKLPLTLSGTGSSLDKAFLDQTGKKTIIVPVKTLDQVLGKENSCDFVKIDVEGFELSVLKGALKTITRHKPILFIEMGARNADESKKLAQKLSWLNAQGYVLWETRKTRARKITKKWKPTTPSVNMYLALHAQKHANLIKALPRILNATRTKTLLYYTRFAAQRAKTLILRTFKR